MTLTRPARPGDEGAMCDILNALIAAGGTTAHQRPFDAARMREHYLAPPGLIACTVAEVEGRVAGFQGLAWADDPGDPLPEGWACIATFASNARRGLGTALFAVTRAAARAAGVRAIDATIRADNAGGLAYYARMGFVEYDRLIAIPLRDGRPVDRIRKRLDP